MLLLILFAGCLATCAAQTTLGPSVTTSFIPTETVQTTSVAAPGLNADVVAFIQAAVTSDQELNETTIGPALRQLNTLISRLRPDLEYMVTVKNITRV